MRKLFLYAAMILLTAVLFGCADREHPEEPFSAHEAAVTKLIGDFGAALKNVSLSAPAAVVSESMQEHYGAYVSPTLLAAWQADPAHAPGRLVSSPWPERIEITLVVEQSPAEAYEVQGHIVEITSADKVEEGEGVRRPITLTVQKTGDDWRIEAVTLGAYPDANGLAYENDEYGFTLALPAGWAGYGIVGDRWRGTVADGSGETRLAEAGPIILIRHPGWTVEDPRQDIPIMVFTTAQWEALLGGEFSVGAAPIPPRELDRNEAYVFALPARYNFAFPTGHEEVAEIMDGDPLRADGGRG